MLHRSPGEAVSGLHVQLWRSRAGVAGRGSGSEAEYQQLITQAFQPPNQYLQQTPHQTPSQQSQGFQQHAMTAVLPSQMTAPEPSYSLEQPVMPSQMTRHMSHVSSSHYGSPYESPQVVNYQQVPQPSRKRSRAEDFTAAPYEYPGLQQLQAHATGQAHLELPTEQQQHLQFQPDTVNYQYQFPRHSVDHSQGGQSPYVAPTPQPQHHHHRLPNQPPPSKSQRTGQGEASSSQDHGPPSVVGQAGMPAPAARPKGPKLKFTPEDDALLVELKETKDLTWKQIADFFPGRSSGTLQVRYCTKLKAKTTGWTDEMLQKLRTAMQEYEDDRWRIISGKVGSGFSAAACKDKAAEIGTEHEGTTALTTIEETEEQQQESKTE
ncbi:uncharacterized protein LTR77_008608 [Saxophila tyrrhenica]|uniref:Myb-like domain-containing protein n=1 Tax=Saxophila tyrrhenica TaxID=1690608 RepID=A0AAV9P3F7_9PEZI|nr:hypothetical protein LTR77_008608 [Saxophila tyrrhenica]